jgi:hypothetical protein
VPTQNPETYRCICGENTATGQLTPDLERAEHLYEQALSLDSTFALSAFLSITPGFSGDMIHTLAASTAARLRRRRSARPIAGPLGDGHGAIGASGISPVRFGVDLGGKPCRDLQNWVI